MDNDQELWKKDGEWKEVIEPEGSGTTYLFRTDGSMMSAVTYANHDTYLRSLTWEAEDHKNTFKINYKAYPVEYTLMRLTADELEFGYDKQPIMLPVPRKRENSNGSSAALTKSRRTLPNALWAAGISARATRRRKASGKRSPTVSLMKGGTNIPSKAPSPPTRVRVAGAYRRTDAVESECRHRHSSYKPLDSDKVSRVRITLEDDRTMYVFYSVNFDPATGEMREGEYRDLLLKD